MPETAVADATSPEVHRIKFSLVDTLEENLESAKHFGKKTSDATEELMDDTAERVRRHPAESLVMAFVAGFFIGGFVSWLTRRK